MGKGTEHAADEAGGEVYFSSDGLDPLPIPNPPALTSHHTSSDAPTDDGTTYDSKTSSNQTYNDVLESDTHSIQPEKAFEIFRGRVFSTIRPGSTVKDKQQDDETLLQRLARLQSEIEDVERDLKCSAKSNIATEKQTDQAGSLDEKVAVQDLTNIASDLSRRLSSLSVQQRQKDLTLQIQKEYTNLKSSRGLKLMNNDKKGQGELLEKDSELKRSFTIEQELRLSKIEAMLGTGQIGVSNEISSGNIVHRLMNAERKLDNMDEKTLINAANRAKVIRADLEAAAKARTKINNAMTAIGSEDTKTIVKLHDLLLDLDGFLQDSSSTSNILSILVDRMSACSGLHTKASEFESKLISLEQMAKQGQAMLKNVEDCLGKLEEGLMSNMKVVEGNIEDIDKRLDK